MKLSMNLEPVPSPQWQLARQVGAEGAVFFFLSHTQKDPSFLSYQNLGRLVQDLKKEDLEFLVAEGDPLPLDRVKLGLPGRDEDIRKYCDFVKVLGDLGVPLVCYNFMAGMNWARTKTDVRLRGGALASAFDYADMKGTLIETKGVTVTKELVWDNLAYFLERVLPVAEKAGVRLALHPDDPPMETFCNVQRVVVSPEAYRRLFREFDSPMNGLTFCQSNFKLMGGNVYDLAEEFGKAGKIFFIHIRDVSGDKEKFHETFHDDGPTDMARLMATYRAYASTATMRPDHVPTLAGEDNSRSGYTFLGMIHAMGYIKGLIQGCDFAARQEFARSPFKRFGCSVCGYTYDPLREGFSDTNGVETVVRFDQLSDAWQCPQCGSAKASLKAL